MHAFTASKEHATAQLYISPSSCLIRSALQQGLYQDWHRSIKR